MPTSHTGFLRDLTRAVSWHRRLLAAGLAAAAVAVGLHAMEPAAAPTARVLAASRDLPGGAALAGSDLRPLDLPESAVPAGAVEPGDRVEGRLLAAPVREGEPLTDVRLLGPSLLATYGSHAVAAPVRVADSGVLALVQVGDHVDVLAAETEPERVDQAARTLVRAARVIALPGRSAASEEGLGSVAVPGDGGLVVLAVRPEVAAELARAAVAARLSLVLRPPP